jgi:hypothetical protein
MKTAEELFREKFTPGFAAMPPRIPKYIYESMIEFAQMHVEAALKDAWTGIKFDGSDVLGDSILKSYPLTNIK